MKGVKIIGKELYINRVGYQYKLSNLKGVLYCLKADLNDNEISLEEYNKAINLLGGKTQ